MSEASNNNDVKADLRRLELTLESKPESADLAESQVANFAARANYAKEQCEEIGLAVRESVANAVLHGNRCDPQKKVFLTASIQAHGLVIGIRDEGEGFTPESLPNPLVPPHLHRESGRGLLLVKTLMDEVIVRRAAPGGMEVTMTKHRSKRA
jgi:serine/threonine-protein kinase RsbW